MSLSDILNWLMFITVIGFLPVSMGYSYWQGYRDKKRRKQLFIKWTRALIQAFDNLEQAEIKLIDSLSKLTEAMEKHEPL